VVACDPAKYIGRNRSYDTEIQFRQWAMLVDRLLWIVNVDGVHLRFEIFERDAKEEEDEG
jgi:hypothetical protein